MKQKLIVALTFALSLVMLPAFAGISKVHGKHYSIELDPAFNTFATDVIPLNGGKPMSSNVFVGKYKSMDLRLWVMQLDSGFIADKDLDATLTEAVKGGYDGILSVIKRDYPDVKLSYDKINKIEQGGAPAREILFEGTFGGQKVEGFVVTIYKNDKITMLMGGAQGLKSEFSEQGTKILDDTSDSLKVLPVDSQFHLVNNDDFSMVLPKIISMKVHDMDDKAKVREYEFTGSTESVDTGFMFAVVDAQKMTDQNDINNMLEKGVKDAVKDYSDEMKMLVSGSTLSTGEVQSLKLVNNHQGKKQTFMLKKGADEMKGEARMIYTGDKIVVIIAKTVGLKGSPDEKDVAAMTDSLDSLSIK